MRWGLLGYLAAQCLAVAGCAILGGFDLTGYTASPDGTGPTDAGAPVDRSSEGATPGGDVATVALEAPADATARDDADSSWSAADAMEAGALGPVDSAVEATVALPVDATFDAGRPEADATTADASRLAADATAEATREDVDAMTRPDAPLSGACPGDAASCGACGQGCLGGGCVAGQCQPSVLATATSPVGLAATNSTVYWAEGNDIKTIPAVGGAASVYFSGSTAPYGSLVVDATNAYWSMDSYVETQFLGGPGGKSYFDKVWSSSQTLTALAVDFLPASVAFVTRPANLYAVRHTTQGGACATASIDVAPLMQGASVTPWTTGVCNVVRMASDFAFLYWTDTGTGNSFAHPAVWRRGILGGASEPVAAAQAPFGIAVYDGTVYWTDSNVGVMQYDVRVSLLPTQLAKAVGARDLSVDSSGVYWIEDQNGQLAIRTVSFAGGPPRTLASGMSSAFALATNTNSVFWLDHGTQDHNFTNGAVMKVAK